MSWLLYCLSYLFAAPAQALRRYFQRVHVGKIADDCPISLLLGFLRKARFFDFLNLLNLFNQIAILSDPIFVLIDQSVDSLFDI